MRITLTLDEELLESIRTLARERGEPVDTVVSGLVRGALVRQQGTSSSAFPTFVTRRDAPPITSETVEAALDDQPFGRAPTKAEREEILGYGPEGF